jgi:hypothetical protein
MEIAFGSEKKRTTSAAATSYVVVAADLWRTRSDTYTRERDIGRRRRRLSNCNIRIVPSSVTATG